MACDNGPSTAAKPQDALVSGTSVAVESLGMGERISSLGEGKEVDTVAVDGNPLDDITRGNDAACSP